MNDRLKKKAEDLAILFEGRTLHRPARIAEAEKILQYAVECGQRKENDACAEIVEGHDCKYAPCLTEQIRARFITDGEAQLEEFYKDSHLHGVFLKDEEARP